MKKEERLLLIEIAKRADNKGILMFDRLSLMMDLEIAMEQFNLKLNDLLNADDFNFCHDICGIQNHINRETREIENFFVPRFCGKY